MKTVSTFRPSNSEIAIFKSVEDPNIPNLVPKNSFHWFCKDIQIDFPTMEKN